MIGIDYDGANYFRALKIYFNCASIARTEISETHNGLHFRIKKKAGLIKQMHTRLNLSDCKGRVAFDELKIRAGLFELVDTLFKYKKSDGPWFQECPISEGDLLAPPFWECRIALKRKRWKEWEKKHR